MVSSFLAFDTATAACSVALSLNGEVRERSQIAPQRHAELILPMVESLLAEAGVTLRSLNAIAFGCGPGSFMGVRIAAGIAQGLGFGADLPLIPISTIQILAQTAYLNTGEKDILAALDARMNALYWGAYRLGEHNIQEAVQPDQLSAPEDITAPELSVSWCAAGNGWAAYRPLLTPVLKSCRRVIEDIYPQAGAMIEIARHLYAAGKVCDPEHAEPIYLRHPVTSARP